MHDEGWGDPREGHRGPVRGRVKMRGGPGPWGPGPFQFEMRGGPFGPPRFRGPGAGPVGRGGGAVWARGGPGPRGAGGRVPGAVTPAPRSSTCWPRARKT